MKVDVSDFVARVASVLPKRRPIEHHEPEINGTELDSINSALVAGISGRKLADEFSASLSKACDVPYVTLTSSGTAALHVALLAAGVEPNDEVLVPSLTFAATANAVVFAGAVPNFVDGALGINAYKLRCYLIRETGRHESKVGRVNTKTGRRIRAIVVVHLLGCPADIAGLSKVANDFGLVLIEDAAEALGSQAGNRPCGAHGLVGILSFNNNKICTSNGGGAILTSDPWVAAKAWQLSTTARLEHPWKVEHDAVAYNYRMGEINAALGLAQLERLEEFLVRKSNLAGKYSNALAGCRGVGLLAPRMHSGDRCNNWLVAVELDSRCASQRDEILDALHAEGIKARALFTPLHQLPMYKDHPRDSMGYAEDTASRLICLPSGAGLCG